jgi:WD40 repeat protein
MKRIASLLLLSAVSVFAQEKKDDKLKPIAVVAYKGGPVDYEKDVLPILENKCTSCHSGANKKGRLDLSSYEALLKGGKHGPSMVTGKPETSLLIQLAGKTQKPAMPPEEDEPLTPEELAILKAWVAQGGKGSTGTIATPKTAAIKLSKVSEKLQPVLALSISPDKKTIAVGRGTSIYLYPADKAETLKKLVDADLKTEQGPLAQSQLDLVQSLIYSADGKKLYSGGYQEVVVWDVATGKVAQRFTGLADRVVAMDISPDGKFLAVSGGAPTQEGEVVVFDLSTGKQTLRLNAPHSDTVFGIRYSPDGTMLATSGADKFVKVWAVQPLVRPDTTSQAVASVMNRMLPFPTPGAALSRQVMANQQCKELNFTLITPGTQLRSYEGHTHHVLDVAWRADGKTLVSAGADQTIKVWDFDKGEQIRTIGGHTKQISRLAMLKTAPMVISACGDAGLRQWNIDNGGNVRAYPGATDFLHAVAATNDGSLIASGGEEGIVRLYNGQSGALVKTIGK